MFKSIAKELQIYPIGWPRFAYTGAGSGSELGRYLASNGIPALVHHIGGSGLDRLELQGDEETATVQSLLDDWKR